MIYQEHLSSNRTLALFAVLTAIFGRLLSWRLSSGDLDGWAIAFLVLAAFFLFYTINYRVLQIQLTGQALILRFGVFKWIVSAENISGIWLDHLPALKRYGGAGIHFMYVAGRYRASFNFLEYPRVLVILKHKAGPIQDLSFSTRHPKKLIDLIQQLVIAQEENL